MNYEQKYKNALEWARQVMNGETGFIRKEVEEIFPELAEAEDERIRKYLLELANRCPEDSIDFMGEVKKENVISWLEKQGQVKESSIPQHENKTCEENSNFLTSEDERIRRAIIEIVYDTPDFEEDYNVNKEDIFAWLEKQRKPTWSEEDNTIADNLAWAIANDKIRPQDRDDYCEWLKSLKQRLGGEK